MRTIKFVDRSFNCSVKHADEILSFILENAPKMPKVCFHLEIAADILAESTLALLEKAPKGLFQVEAGIQSFHPETLLAVSRKNDLEKICENVRKIISFGTVHTHVDLIAGLPNEGFLEFRNSFNKAYALGADMLQLGFLKLLYGSRLRKEAKEHGYIFETHAPYTVKASKWLSEGEMEKISFVEDANEKIANSGRFEKSLSYVLQKSSLSPFDLFLGFGKREPMPLDAYTDEVYEYFCSLNGVDEAVLRDLMCIDRLRTNKTGKLPKSLRRTDENLKKTVLAIEAMHPREKGVKRAVCLLYTQNKAVYVDYRSGEEMPFLFSYAPIAKQNEKQ